MTWRSLPSGYKGQNKKPGYPGFFLSGHGGLADLEGPLHQGEVAREGAEEGEILARQAVGLEGDAGALAAPHQLGVGQDPGSSLGRSS